MTTLHEAEDDAARQAIIGALTSTYGDVRAASKLLNVAERTLWLRIKRLGISVAQYR